jgi:lipid A 3-O-deacylase
MKRHFIFFLFCWFPCFAFCQTISQKHEIGITSEDDSYVDTHSDRYYTNGTFLYYRFLSPTKSKKINKKIIEFKIGQQIYTPYQSNVPSISMQDRPFAGYLFAEAGMNKFYQDGSVLKLSSQLGILGPGSMAEQVQTIWHQIINYVTPEGWQYQVKNTPGAQMNIFGSKNLFPVGPDNHFDANGILNVQAGTIFNSITLGILSRASISKLLPLYSSNMFGASIGGNTRNVNEAYLYFLPEVNYTFYDATIEGGLFKKNSPLVFGIIPFRYKLETGLRVRVANVIISYAIIFISREVDNRSTRADHYGSISLSFLF